MASHNVKETYNENLHLKCGEKLSNPAPKDEVVITGMSGVFPNSANIDELKYNLYNKKDMVLYNSRYASFCSEMPKKLGIMPRIKDFDPGNFGLHWRLANISDPVVKICFEIVFETILDAGINPADLENTNTGLFIGNCFCESERGLKKYHGNNFFYSGTTKSGFTAKLAYFLKIKGPVVILDTACSSSLHALEMAFKDIRMGRCDAAFVLGANTCLYAGSTLQFRRLGVLSPDAVCKSFDENCNGYVRAEAVVSIFVQKAKDAKRVYAQIINAKANCDGFKEQGITYPSGQDQKQLLEELYKECNIPPESISYLEAHGTGTKVGDPEECNALDDFFCKNRKTPLFIGSVKSNLGHTEPSSGLCSVIKVLLGFESGCIAPNIYFNTPNPEIHALVDGRMKVVTEPTKIEGERPLIGVNSFGFGGSNSHVLLKCITKKETCENSDDLPRLVFVSGRSEEAVLSLLDDVGHRQLNVNHVRLLQSSFSKYIPAHHYRGYNIISKTGEIKRAIYFVTSLKVLPLYVVFGKLSNWETLIVEFLSVPCFDKTLHKVETFLISKNLSLNTTILNPQKELRREFNILGSIIMQIGIVDILKTLKLKITTVLGYSYGEIICAYYDNILTLNEVLDCALILNGELHLQMNGDSGQSTSSKSIQHVSANSLAKKLSSVLNTPRFWNNGSMKKKIASAEYFADAVHAKIEKLEKVIKSNSLVFETVLNCFGDIVQDLNNVQVFSFQNFNDFLQSLGSLYFLGYLSSIDQLYPKVEFPVKRSTPMISSKIKWNRTRKWYLNKDFDIKHKQTYKTYIIDVRNKVWEYMNGHVIDGRNLFPAAGYLYLAWTTLLLSEIQNKCSVLVENCRFLRATTLNNTSIKFEIHLSDSGYFEISEGKSIVVTGKITINSDKSLEMMPLHERIKTHNVMSQKNVYKELRLRGYNYSGSFRGIQEADINGKSCVIKYANNWVTYLDNLFQMKILSKDSRNLYVPTYIDYIKLDFGKQQEFIDGDSNEVDCDAFYYSDVDVIRSGGVEIKGLFASAIQRKRCLGTPVLESYNFIPNNTNLSYKNSIRVNTQILLENTLFLKIKSIELVDDETITNTPVLSEMVVESFEDQPLIQPEAKILSSMQLETSLEVENKNLCDESDCALIIGSKLFKRPQILLDATKALKDNGFIISREPLNFNPQTITQTNISVITVHHTDEETLVMLAKIEKKKPPTYIEIFDDPEFNWLRQVQAAMKKSDNVIVYSQNNPTTGLLGFANCLKREPSCQNVCCFLILDENRTIDSKSEIFKEQIKKNLTVNVFKNGQWGTYRHLILPQNEEALNEHTFAKIMTRGDLSSFKWVAGPLRYNMNLEAEDVMIQVYYSALNFKDVMTASGKISVDVAHSSCRLEQDIVEGFEFSGIDQNGRRVMGMKPGGLANITISDRSSVYEVPNEWTLKEAASVICAYSTVIYALFERGKIRKGESVLIHSGTGGLGQAAIHLCLHYGYTVFTTCGSTSKKEFLLQKYPQLKDSHIGNSRDTSFEKLIMRETNGRGVDIVLNSLADEKLQASIRCLGKGGRFLEIGKFDLSNNTALNLLLLEKDISFHGILLDIVFKSHTTVKKRVQETVKKCLRDGAIKPLDVTVFSTNEVEQAFRFMASGKHMGKVLIEIKPEGSQKQEMKSFPRFYCKPEKSYVILGGLGGFGLELADWLVLRGAKNIVLASRTGINNGYQKRRIQLWRNDYGLSVNVSTANITTKEGCELLIQEASKLGPIGGIFNLAVVLQDGIFENQTVEMYKTSFAPKAYATKHLDDITRICCPQLDYFVVFSSVSCGRGNAGQTNYGMANSIMERICERRRKDGLPGIAIQWGAIGEVGLVADMNDDHKDLEIGGTLQQRLSSCLEVLDLLLEQKTTAIVSSIVVAEKKSMTGAENPSDAVANILGLDLKLVQDTQTLAELGMDSMTAVEIKQVFEREYGIFLTAKDIRTLTFARIKEIENERINMNEITNSDENAKEELLSKALELVMNSEKDERIIIQLKSNVSDEKKAPTILLLPGMEGNSNILKPLARKLNAHVIAFHFDFNNPVDNISEMTKAPIGYIESKLNKNEPIYIVAHSYGTCLALEMTSYLEKKGYKCIVICLDGSPRLMINATYIYPNDEAEFETQVLRGCLDVGLTSETSAKFGNDIVNLTGFEEKLSKGVEVLYEQTQALSKQQLRQLLKGIVLRFKALKTYKCSYSLNCKVVLCKASRNNLFKTAPKDFYLEEDCGQPVEVIEIEGDHVSIINNDQLAEVINSFVKE